MERKWWYWCAAAVVAHAAVGYAVPALLRGHGRSGVLPPTESTPTRRTSAGHRTPTAA